MENRRTPVLRAAFLALSVTALACSPAQPLGDGSLSGRLPPGWQDVQGDDPGITLRLHDETVPLPREILVRPLLAGTEASTDGWRLIEELTVPAPDTPVGDGWQPNTRRVRRYRRAFPGLGAFEADVDTLLDERIGERFLASLRPTR